MYDTARMEESPPEEGGAITTRSTGAQGTNGLRLEIHTGEVT